MGSVGDVRSFLVESYAELGPGLELELVARRAHAAEHAGGGVRHVGSVLLSDDEICLHVFEAPSAAALAGAADRAGLVHDRVVEAVWIPASSGGE